jgi:predicted transglutaminase-like cysteine proteinase
MRTAKVNTRANISHRGLRASVGVLALVAATALAAAPMTAAAAEPSSLAPSGAQYLSLGASAAYAFQENSSGSALAQITRSQTAPTAAVQDPAASPVLAPSVTVQLAALQAPARIDAAIGRAAPLQPFLQPALDVKPAVLTAPLSSTGPDLFGSKALKISHSALDPRWMHAVHARAPTDSRWVEIVKTASRLPERERLARVNAWINHAITFESDQQNYGVSDYWASARETMARGRGDCEDYAIAKMELLRASGVPASDLYIVIAKDLVRRADHALLAVRSADGYWLLDSNADEVLPAAQSADYHPVVTFSAAGGEWMHGYRRQPVFRVASADGLAPASAR